MNDQFETFITETSSVPPDVYPPRQYSYLFGHTRTGCRIYNRLIDSLRFSQNYQTDKLQQKYETIRYYFQIKILLTTTKNIYEVYLL